MAVVQEKQREIQKRRNAKSYRAQVVEVMVEGKKPGPGTMDWPHLAEQDAELYRSRRTAHPTVGDYVTVVTTGTFPNSLVGEMVI